MFCCSLRRKLSKGMVSLWLVVVLVAATLYLTASVMALYHQYQKADRLREYLNEVDMVLENSRKLQAGAESLADQFRQVRSALRSSLSINLSHKDKEPLVP